MAQPPPAALITVEGGDPTPVLGRFYFSAATILGRGSVAFRPSTDLFQLVEELAAASGVLLLSLSIAYILPVVSAVTNKRHVAVYVSSLGGTPDEILTRAWDGRSFGDLHLHLVNLTPLTAKMAEQHLAFPVLHYFHSGERETALGPSIVLLDETLTVLDRAVDPEHRIDASAIGPLRVAIDRFLRSLTKVAVEPADEPLAVPPLSGYRARELPLAPPDEIGEIFEELADRRKLLAGFLEHDGWTSLEARSLHPEPAEEAVERTEPHEAGADGRGEGGGDEPVTDEDIPEGAPGSEDAEDGRQAPDG